MEWLALNASVRRAGEQMGYQFRLPRGGLERSGVCLPLEGRSATFERGGDVVRFRGPWRGGLERSGDCSAGSRGARMGCTVELGCEPSVYWASREPREDSGAVRELQMLHGIRV